MRVAAAVLTACLAAGAASAREQAACGPNLGSFACPHPVRTFAFESERFHRALLEALDRP